ncbi:SCO family protein, partial [Streptomyces sp. SID8455]|nr:SCO family protein [Streptomyces sp. SID8455]
MRNRKAVTAVAFAAAAALALSACGSGDDKAGSSSIADVEASPKTKAATVLDRPFTKPNLVLTDTNGKEYDFREATKGKPTLIYFGYTN